MQSGTNASFFDSKIGPTFNGFGASLSHELKKLNGKESDAGNSDIDTLDFNKRFVSINRETMLEFFQKRAPHAIAGDCVDYFLKYGRPPSKSEMDDLEIRAKHEQEKRNREMKHAKLDPALPVPCYT